MKLPNKLEKVTNLPKPSPEVRALIISADNNKKINEILDYLLDKDVGNVRESLQVQKAKEASKGEDFNKCEHEAGKKCPCGDENCRICSKCDISFIKPPQQEESRGECVGAGNRHPDSSEMYCSKCGSNNRQLKEESPKEDECFSYIRNMLVSQEYSTLEIMTYLRKHLVSKVKIKKAIEECTLFVNPNVLDKPGFIKELGLEEL